MAEIENVMMMNREFSYNAGAVILKFKLMNFIIPHEKLSPFALSHWVSCVPSLFDLMRFRLCFGLCDWTEKISEERR